MVKKVNRTSAEGTTGVSEKAAQIFESYPNRKEVFFTSDGLAFLEECDAKNHASGLQDKEVKKETKQD